MDMSVKVNQVYTPPLAPVVAVAPADAASLAKAPDAVTPPAAASEPASREDLEKALGEIRDFARDNHRNLDFSIDEDSGRVVVKVIATDSGLVIRQIPSEAALKLAQNLNDANSLLFKDEV
ncbi:flagellar protein FlaG [Pseudomonas sp. UBA6562]|uniref:flagellar protein FlaG n=1 Tax=Pseudomonas sp. UBA6562 TaxID=1947332 RepID=UPI0025F4303E|nr:flagellar protein FlaG [Pseudomonas sp. UBA6562]